MSKISSLAMLGVLTFFAILMCFCKPEETEMSKEIKEFFELPLRERHEKITQFDFEMQYEIYMYAMIKRHPPDLMFSYDIASQGERIVPFLTEKLRQTDDESVQEKIIFIFRDMTWGHGVDLRNNEELIDLINEVVSSMTDDYYYKGLSERYLREIMAGPESNSSNKKGQ
jgi:hypothetical protein